MNINDTYRIKYPFVKEEKYILDEEGSSMILTWRPGTKAVRGYFHHVAHDHGYMLLTIISFHKPGKYQDRVFYIRQWESPEGRIFGKKHLRIISKAGFKKLLRGYRHYYDMEQYDKKMEFDGKYSPVALKTEGQR